MENLKISKKELVKEIAEEKGLTQKEVESVVSTFLGKIEEALVSGCKVSLHDFGIFEVRDRAARQGRNPRNPEQVIDIPASKAIAFKVSKPLKEKVNK